MELKLGQQKESPHRRLRDSTTDVSVGPSRELVISVVSRGEGIFGMDEPLEYVIIARRLK